MHTTHTAHNTTYYATDNATKTIEELIFLIRDFNGNVFEREVANLTQLCASLSSCTSLTHYIHTRIGFLPIYIQSCLFNRLAKQTEQICEIGVLTKLTWLDLKSLGLITIGACQGRFWN
jgi:hypothetical protein